MITISGRSSTKVGVTKWCKRLILAPLKPFKCIFTSHNELLNRFLLTHFIWLSPTTYIFLPYFVVLQYDLCLGKLLLDFQFVSYYSLLRSSYTAGFDFFSSWFRFCVFNFDMLMIISWRLNLSFIFNTSFCSNH